MIFFGCCTLEIINPVYFINSGKGDMVYIQSRCISVAYENSIH
jgi:hypothetical protein